MAIRLNIPKGLKNIPKGPPDMPIQAKSSLENIQAALNLWASYPYEMEEPFDQKINNLAQIIGKIANSTYGMMDYPDIMEPPSGLGINTVSPQTRREPRPPFSSVLKPTGGNFDPGVDYTQSIIARLRNLIRSDLDTPAQNLLNETLINFDPHRTDYNAGVFSGRPRISLGKGNYVGSGESLPRDLKHELLHLFLRQHPVDAMDILRTGVGAELPLESLNDTDHILTYLAGLGKSANISLYESRTGGPNIPGIPSIPTSLEDFPEDLRPFYSGFYKRYSR